MNEIDQDAVMEKLKVFLKNEGLEIIQEHGRSLTDIWLMMLTSAYINGYFDGARSVGGEDEE